MRRIVFAQELAPSVRGEALKTVEKKRQDFGNMEGCAQEDSVEQLQRDTVHAHIARLGGRICL